MYSNVNLMSLDYAIIKLSTNQLRERSNITLSQREEGISKILMNMRDGNVVCLVMTLANNFFINLRFFMNFY